MRHAQLFAVPAAVLLTLQLATAFQLPNLEPFLAAIPISLSDYIPASLSNQTAQHEQQQQLLLRRQFSNTCPTNFNSCANIGGSGLCCAPNAVCSADAAGHVACCPSGAACSGTISGVITAGTVNSNGAIVGGGGAAATTGPGSSSGLVRATTTTGFQTASPTSGNGLIVASTQSTTGAAAGGGGSTAPASGTNFILASGTPVATPGAGVRGLQIVSHLCKDGLNG